MKPRSPHQKLLLLQHRIFRSLQADADRLLGETPPAIRSYEREYGRDFQRPLRTLRAVPKKDLIHAMRSVDVTLIADYHTFYQAQRTALRLIRETVQAGEPWYIGLEMIPSHHQEFLDRYQRGECDLQAFHECIRYEDEWGFPWKNYAPIFEWARDRKVPLIALNQPKALYRVSASLRRARHDAELHGRDQWAAGIITDLFAREMIQGRRPRMIVLYGELHVASSHLPAQLKRISRQHFASKAAGNAKRSKLPARAGLKIVSIHQNNDHLYWRLARTGREIHTDAIKLGRDSYCVISSTPWAKLQSLISWAEGEAPGADADGGSGGESRDGVDYLSAISSYGKTIAEFLNIAPPSFERLTVRTINEADFVDDLAESRRDLRLIRYHVSRNLSLYIPRAAIAYLGSPSQNIAAELAAVHLHGARARVTQLFVPEPEDFYRMVIQATFGFFGSLIINPRRKCDLPKDHLRFLRLSALKSGASTEIEARKLTLNILAHQKSHSQPAITRAVNRVMTQPRLTPAAMLAARFIGQIQGKRLHQALLSGGATLEQIRHLCLSPPDTSVPFSEKYTRLVRLVASAPTISSKADRL